MTFRAGLLAVFALLALASAASADNAVPRTRRPTSDPTVDQIGEFIQGASGLIWVPLEQFVKATGALGLLINGLPAANQSTASAKNVQRIRGRTFVGHALDANDGGDYYHMQSKDWLEGLIQGSTSKGNLNTLSEPGVTTGFNAGTRTSDSVLGFDYAFAGAFFGINDNSSPQRTLITLYNETRGYAGSGTSQNAEFDAINSGASYPTLSPYDWASHLPATINLWLSSGRPDIELVHLGGTITVGNTITLTMTPSGGSAISVTYTVLAGDTLPKIATGLTALINAAAPFTGAGLYAAAVNTTVSIGNHLTTMTWAYTLSSGATEVVILDHGNPTSTGIGLINNCNNLDCGKYVTGIFFDANSLVGTDGSDGSTGLGEAIAFGRNHTMNFYHANGAGTASVLGASLYSKMTSAAANRWFFKFRDDGVAIGNDTTSTDVALFSTGGETVTGALSVSGNVYPQQGIALTPTTVAALPVCNSTTNKDVLRAVTDATTPTYNGALTGGGSAHIPVYCDDVSWKAH